MIRSSQKREIVLKKNFSTDRNNATDDFLSVALFLSAGAFTCDNEFFGKSIS
jgi:hypothetical protein